MKKAIEVEYWVVDDGGELTPPGPLTEVSQYTEEEFVEPLFELKTPPCESVDDLRETFLEQLDEVLDVADRSDRHLVPLGTPIYGESVEQLDDERSRIQNRVLGAKFDFAKYCAGTHVHFEKRNVVDQLNVLIALDPALALANSSPYFQGERIADGARAYLYRKKGYEDYPKHGQLWEYVETVAEWERRLEHRFEEFKEAAIDAGIDEARVDESFSPDDTVWTPVRLREEMPTVEWRSPDATLPSQIVVLVEQVDEILEALHHTNVRLGDGAGRVTDDAITLPEFDTLCDYAEEAIHDGVTSQTVSSYLDRMGFDVDTFDPLTREVGRRQTVTRAEACEIRLEYGDRLRDDVESLLARA